MASNNVQEIPKLVGQSIQGLILSCPIRLTGLSAVQRLPYMLRSPGQHHAKHAPFHILAIRRRLSQYHAASSRLLSLRRRLTPFSELLPAIRPLITPPTIHNPSHRCPPATSPDAPT